jgi:hypothetical protein
MSAAEVQALIDSKPLAQQVAADPEVKAASKHGKIGNGRIRSDVVTSTQRSNGAYYRFADDSAKESLTLSRKRRKRG